MTNKVSPMYRAPDDDIVVTSTRPWPFHPSPVTADLIEGYSDLVGKTRRLAKRTLKLVWISTAVTGTFLWMHGVHWWTLLPLLLPLLFLWLWVSIRGDMHRWRREVDECCAEAGVVHPDAKLPTARMLK